MLVLNCRANNTRESLHKINKKNIFPINITYFYCNENRLLSVYRADKLSARLKDSFRGEEINSADQSASFDRSL